MKKEYKKFIIIFGIEICFVSILNGFGVVIDSYTGNAIGVLLILAPILRLLYLLSRDSDIEEKYRYLSKIGFRFLVCCFKSGAIGEAITRGYIDL